MKKLSKLVLMNLKDKELLSLMSLWTIITQKVYIMKYTFTFILFVFVFVQCHTVSKNEPEKTKVEIIAKPDTLPPLEAGEVSYKGDEPFGEIIELKGRHITGDTAIFKARSYMVRDSILVMHQGFYEPLKAFKFPELIYMQDLGNIGNGPGELLRPILVRTADTSALCYIMDECNYNSFFKLTKDFQLKQIKSPLKGERYMLSNVYYMGNGECLYLEKSPSGHRIKRSILKNDSVITREVQKLNLRNDQKFWGAYLGSLGIDIAKNRMVYAYDYYRIIKFMDLEGKQVRTIKFIDEIGYDDNTEHMTNGLDHNVQHYDAVYAGGKYIYIRYIGMTPIDKFYEGQKGIYVTYIEKYDWNGNPICKYKLDQSGHLYFDDINHKLYLASRYYDEPFFVYDLPE